MWQCDAIVDFANDFIPKIAKILFVDKNYGAEGQKEYLSFITAICTFLTKKLAHGKDFLVGDKITIADFHVASIVMACTCNEGFAGGKEWSDKAR